MPTKSESAGQSLYRMIAEAGEVSLHQLSRTLGLRPSSLNSKIRPLIKKGLCSYASGRTRIAVNPDFGCVAGIDMGASHLHVAWADFTGEIRDDATLKIQPEDGPRKMIGQIKAAVRDLAGKGGRGRLQALAIGVPSPVDAKHGVVTFANNLPGWEKVHLGHDLERAFRVPVFIENDANMAALGERWKGVARGVNDFVFIALGTGVGSGLILNGKLYTGRNGAAGELFRTNIDWQTWGAEFPDTGQFETFVSGMGIAAEGRKVLAMPPETPGLAQERDAYFVFESFRQGSVKARTVLEKIFTMLGVGVANLVGILDPDLIVLGGGVTKGAPEFMLEVVEKVVHRLQPNPPPIKYSLLGDKAQTYGAISSALGVARENIIRDLKE